MTNVMIPPAEQQPSSGTRPVLATEQEAREVAEAAREQEWASSFVKELFAGRLLLDLVHPFPEPTAADVAKAQPFLDKLERFLRDNVDSDRIDREGKIPPHVLDGLREIGAFGIKIAEEYGGLGLSQLMYTKAIALVTSVDGSLTALLSASQSIGVPVPSNCLAPRRRRRSTCPGSPRGRSPPSRSPRTTWAAIPRGSPRRPG